MSDIENMDSKEDVDLEEIAEEVSGEDEGIAMELLHEFKEQNKRMDEHNQRLIGIIKTMSISFVTTVILIIAMFLGIFLYVASNFEFESYSQDGSGYNNINTGTQGDVYNGTEIPESQEE